ncbi:Biotin carboxylase [Streptomyces sp. DvalAA-14]|uniref:ATP-grasp domain-containing protein n=1 Tax=unclassified Streptomyces TaxID=2593676 RepID=UPI00081B688F|nr:MULTISPECIES: ATP-grasp domain-containing protein [unclassified Streptomyces]MYS19829.1 ATP-grasp domain-containing protein [Streptomyces sp. SID4948]SCD54366.1 Biotin carboxylase [Streptomyces sp. DvalAA-14]
MTRTDIPPAVLIGARPAEGHATLTRMGIPFLCVVDPSEKLPPVAGALEVIEAPYRQDPLCLLNLPLPRRVCAVFSFTEFGLLPAALLSEALGLPSVPVGAVLRTRNKLLMRHALAGAFDGPQFGVVGRDEPAADVFPLVAKPIEGSGSRGVEFVADPAEYLRRRTELAGLLWERCVDGPEYSVEAVSFDGRHRILGITAKRTTGRPHFIETGHAVPAPLDPAVREEIDAAVRRCLDALGVNVGASHTEVKVENGRALIVETHTRAGGDRIPLLTRLVSGVDQYELAVQSVLPWADPHERLPEHGHAAVHYFPWQDVVFTDGGGIDACRSAAGVVEIELQVGPGDIIPVWRHSHERPGHVVIGAGDADELRQRVASVDALLRSTFG